MTLGTLQNIRSFEIKLTIEALITELRAPFPPAEFGIDCRIPVPIQGNSILPQVYRHQLSLSVKYQ